ncbi:MAG: type II toxin-antitoxin system ParD family antitoxin [Pseudohongiellaceae bacterium]
MDTTRKIKNSIQQDKNHKDHTEAIRAALIEGEESGDAKPFDVELFKRKMAARYVNKLR